MLYLCELSNCNTRIRLRRGDRNQSLGALRVKYTFQLDLEFLHTFWNLLTRKIKGGHGPTEVTRN